jgi:hypothetical protein
MFLKFTIIFHKSLLFGGGKLQILTFQNIRTKAIRRVQYLKVHSQLMLSQC